MKKYIMFLLLACVVGVGYAKVYNVEDTIYSSTSEISILKSDTYYVLKDFELDNIASVKVSWTEPSDSKGASCAYSLSSMAIAQNISSGSTFDTQGKKTLTVYFRRTSNINEAYLSSITISVVSVCDVYIRESLTPGSIGTVCLPKAVAEGKYSGATFYEVEGRTETQVFFSEVTALEAGKPYVFSATEPTMNLICSDPSVVEAGHYNGLYGVFERFAFADHLSELNINDVYIIKDNEVRKASAKSGVNANRAYLKLSEIPSISSAPEGRTLVLGYEPEESGSQTGVGDIIDEKDVPLIIHTLQGQRVKKVVKDDFYIVNRKEVKYLKAE